MTIERGIEERAKSTLHPNRERPAIRRRWAIGLLLALLYFASGCATIFNSRRQEVFVVTNPLGATVQIQDMDGAVVEEITAPAPAYLPRESDGLKLIATMPSYEPARLTIDTSVSNLIWLNCLLSWLFPIGMLVDFASEEVWQYPNYSYLVLRKIDEGPSGAGLEFQPLEGSEAGGVPGPAVPFGSEAPVPQPAGPAISMVSLKSAVGGVQVYLDGEFRGTLPLRIALDPGKHKVKAVFPAAAGGGVHRPSPVVELTIEVRSGVWSVYEIPAPRQEEEPDPPSGY